MFSLDLRLQLKLRISRFVLLRKLIGMLIQNFR